MAPTTKMLPKTVILGVFGGVVSTLLGGCVAPVSAIANSTFFQSGRFDQVSSHSVIRHFAQTTSEGHRRIELTLIYEPITEPPFYTPYGPVERLVITEGEHAINISDPKLRTLEDMHPESIQLSSPRLGDYVVVVPHGVPAASHSTISIQGSTLRALTTVEPEIPPAPVGHVDMSAEPDTSGQPSAAPHR